MLCNLCGCQVLFIYLKGKREEIQVSEQDVQLEESHGMQSVRLVEHVQLAFGNVHL